ncbi:BHLH domain-containing protein [Forsythia ovata]|uniref:BHLH domain-containing protein n=1 Tax=Forsythia ovata TaxID=205694 RepID=A0ABD1RJM4_9LAMI
MWSKIEATQPQFISKNGGPKPSEMGFVLEDFSGLVSASPRTETDNSFTALLELPALQDVELLVNSLMSRQMKNPQQNPVFNFLEMAENQMGWREFGERLLIF